MRQPGIEPHDNLHSLLVAQSDGHIQVCKLQIQQCGLLPGPWPWQVRTGSFKQATFKEKETTMLYCMIQEKLGGGGGGSGENGGGQVSFKHAIK